MPNKFAKLLVWLRRALAAIVLVAFAALFTAPWAFAKHLSPLAKAQFWPSVAGGFGIAAIIVVAVTILAGRWYCGVLCPLGAWQDAAFALRRRRSQKAAGKGQWLVRGAFLAAFAALGLAGLGFAWLEPYGIFGRIFTTTVGAVAGVAIFLLAVLRGRAWCNWACPVGTILGLLSRFSPLALKIDATKCVGCRQCEKNCRAAAITIAGKGGAIDPTKCVQCRDCAALCPKGAIACRPAPAAAPAPATPPVAPAPGDGITRRAFVAGAAATVGALAATAAEEKTVDGGFAPISLPGVDARNASLKPAGSRSLANFQSRCVGCQLCVKECPNRVLRPSRRLKDFMQPEMAFDQGFCTPDCTRCSQVCPAGAIAPLTPEEKLHTHVGQAVWHPERCLAATEGVTCNACFRHCPVKAIKRVPGANGAPIPVVDEVACIGCGACEHVCPARPLPGMTVKAFERHREARPMGGGEALDEARALIEKGGHACAVVKGGVIVVAKKGRGVAPLLSVYDETPGALRGAVVFDKAVGKAAAAICALGGAARACAPVASEAAAKLLAARGIPCDAGMLAPRILNRDHSGPCPMERACEGLDDPAAIVEAARQTLKALRNV